MSMMSWLLGALAIVGFALILTGAQKKEPGAKEWPQTIQWGYLFLLVGSFGVLSEFMSFTAVMLIILIATGIGYGLEKFIWSKKRLDAMEGPGHFADYSVGFFPVILVVFVLRSFLVEPFQIPSSSMRPGLVVGDFILVNKFTYGVRVPVANNVIVPVDKVAAGDVIVFGYPPDPKVNYIKRVIGLPGDVVEYRDKKLNINNQAIENIEDGEYEYIEQGLALIQNTQYKETLGGKTFNVITMPEAPVYAPAQVTDFPSRDQCQYDATGFKCTVPQGHYFVLGDNRDNSLDGRYWGFVSDDLLVGKAFLVWLNLSDFSRIGTSIK